MLSQATNISAMARYPWTIASGFTIFAAVLCYNSLGDGIREAFSPRAAVPGRGRPAPVRTGRRTVARWLARRARAGGRRERMAER